MEIDLNKLKSELEADASAVKAAATGELNKLETEAATLWARLRGDLQSELGKLQDEAAALKQKMSQLDEAKNQLVTRLLEIQGAVRWLVAKLNPADATPPPSGSTSPTN